MPEAQTADRLDGLRALVLVALVSLIAALLFVAFVGIGPTGRSDNELERHCQQQCGEQRP